MAKSVSLAALQPFQLDAIPPGLTGGVATIGNFDGVHRGHQALLAAAKAETAKRRVPAVVLTFEPHPRTVLRPEAPVFRLTPAKAKGRVLKALGMEGVAVAAFDRTFASQPPEAFVENVLVDRLRVSGAVVGFNFRFGKMRAGDAAALSALGVRRGFAVTVVD